MKRNITLLIKPASSLCNLRCKYCFYADVAENREVESFGLMTLETARATITKALDFACGGVVTFAFQGGEPTIAPLEFFQSFVAIVEECNTKSSPVFYALQTNGTLLSDPLCEFFAKHNFLVGVSVDGKADLHNANRIDQNGKGTFGKVMQGVDMLKKHKVEFNILTVVTALSVQSAQATYKFFRAHNFEFLQFIICLEPIGEVPFSSGFAPASDGYYKFYKTIFDLYMQDKKAGKAVSIRYFDNLIDMLSGKRPELCGMSGFCAGSLVVEGNGNCYPCDFYCEDKYLLGNINSNSISEMSASKNMKTFQTSSQKIDEKCKTCEVSGICRGGCRRERDVFSSGELELNMYCEGRKKFFKHFLSSFGYGK